MCFCDARASLFCGLAEVVTICHPVTDCRCMQGFQEVHFEGSDLVAKGGAPPAPVACVLALGHVTEGVRLQQWALVEGLVWHRRHRRRILQLVLVEVLQPETTRQLHFCDVQDTRAVSLHSCHTRTTSYQCGVGCCTCMSAREPGKDHEAGGLIMPNAPADVLAGIMLIPLDSEQNAPSKLVGGVARVIVKVHLT